MIEAVLFDLDDTIFPQSAWLSGAWEVVARAAPPGVDREALHRALVEIASEGSDRGRIIDRALERVGAAEVDVVPMVDAFRSHTPSALTAYPGAVTGLANLRRLVPIGLVTDGDVGIQQAKLAALGLAEAFDVVIFSDWLGREQRKPHPAPFLAALESLGVAPSAAVHVGDRPGKDVAGAVAAGLLAIRVCTGEYASQPSPPEAWMELPDVAAACDFLVGVLRAPEQPVMPPGS